MSRWKIAAAQYEPLKTSVREHIVHHLKFIDAAARQQCELLVFPSLSLLGCVDGSQSLPAPPNISLLKPLSQAAHAHRMTIIAGLPVKHNNRFVKGIAVFTPWMTSPRMFHQSHGACLCEDLKTISVVDEQPEGVDMDPACSLFTTSQSVSESELLTSTSRLQYFSHKFSIAVLMDQCAGKQRIMG